MIVLVQSGNPRHLSFSPDRPGSASSPASLNRSFPTTPAQSSLSSPVCMEPATTYVGATADTQQYAGGEQAQTDAWRGGESDHRMMAYSSAAMRSSMDADLALAIALQVFYLKPGSNLIRRPFSSCCTQFLHTACPIQMCRGFHVSAPSLSIEE